MKFNPSYIGSRNDILALIPAGTKRVLDIGCSTGELGKAIKEKFSAKVVGVEMSKDMADIASRKLDQVIAGDIEENKVLSKIKKDKFDVVILGDILEHLCDPWTVLNKLSTQLTSKGIIIASIPNVQHIDTIFNLVIKENWPYRERGIHDKTHMRFFTRKNIIEMFVSAKLKIINIDAHYRIIESPHPINAFAKYFAAPYIRDFLAFQYLIVAYKK